MIKPSREFWIDYYMDAYRKEDKPDASDKPILVREVSLEYDAAVGKLVEASNKIICEQAILIFADEPCHLEHFLTDLTKALEAFKAATRGDDK